MEPSAEELYEDAPCGHVSTDPGGTIVRVNRTFERLTGHRREDVVGLRRFQDLLTAGGRIYHETHYAPLVRMQGAVREIALEVVRADGSRMPALVNAMLVRDAEGEPAEVRTTVLEATHRKRYEQELLDARNRERLAHRRTERLQRMTAALAGAADVEAVAAAVVDALARGVGADAAAIAVREDGSDDLRVLGRHGDASDGEIVGEGPRAAAREPGRGGGAATARVPIATRGGMRGFLWLSFTGADPLAPEERAFAAACAAQAGLALERARLYDVQRDVAHTLQRSLLAGEAMRDPRFEVAALYQPAVDSLEVGGDWHDTFRLPDGRIAVVVGDIVGRGLAAASVMGQLRSAVRALGGAQLGPAGVLSKLDTFVEQLPAAAFATVAYAEVDADTGATRLAAAGHPPPVLLRPGQSPELLMVGRSAPLGVPLDGSPRPEGELRLEPGAGLLLYTDGLVERRTEAIDAGLQRLIDAVAARAELPPAELVAALPAVMLAGGHSDDDVCSLCFVRTPRPAEGRMSTS